MYVSKIFITLNIILVEFVILCIYILYVVTIYIHISTSYVCNKSVPQDKIMLSIILYHIVEYTALKFCFVHTASLFKLDNLPLFPFFIHNIRGKHFASLLYILLELNDIFSI